MFLYLYNIVTPFSARDTLNGIKEPPPYSSGLQISLFLRNRCLLFQLLLYFSSMNERNSLFFYISFYHASLSFRWRGRERNLIHSITRWQRKDANMDVRACMYAYAYAAIHLFKLLVSESVFGCIRTPSCPEALHVVSEKDLKCYLALSWE